MSDHGAAADHGDAHGLDDHGDDAEDLGPIDVAAWGAGALGVGISVVIAFAFVIATGGFA
jgi:hypothetical protein